MYSQAHSLRFVFFIPKQMTSFTPEDIQFFEQLVDRRLEALLGAPAQTTPTPPPGRNYHSIPEIRNIIQENIAEFREWAQSEVFHMEVLYNFILKKVTLRACDSELLSHGGKEASLDIRFKKQFGNTLVTWKYGPVRAAGRRGYYTFTNI
jgi:hypothetical protein